MRGTGMALLGIFTLPLLARASPPPPPTVLVRAEPPRKAAPVTSTTLSASVVSPTALPQSVTTTKTIDALSVINSKTSSSVSSFSSTAVSTSATFAAHSPSLSVSGLPMPSGITNEESSDRHRTLVIVLSTVLGFVGVVLIVGSIFLLYRHRQQQSAFGHRGASPIDDSEIESWRRNTTDQKRPPPAHLASEKPEIRPLTLGSPPGWTWAASPTSIQTVMSPASQYPDSPSFLAKAPNSRIGLTDETVPGADPFIGTVKRQNSRLSKPPPGHIRTKSRRSSMSAKSGGSFKWQNRDRISSDSRRDESNFSWFDPEDETVISQLRTDRTSSSNRASLFDGLAMAGLSPRPQPKQDGHSMYIGRAIG